MKIKNFFLLNRRKVFLVIVLEIASILLHNFIYALTGIEEAFFFLIAVIFIPAYLVIGMVWSLLKWR